MVRRPASAIAVAIGLAGVLLLAACPEREPAAPPSDPPTISPTASPTPSGSPSASPTPSVSASPTTSPGPTPAPQLQLPPDAPTVVDDPASIAEIAASDVTSLVPPGGRVTFADAERSPFHQIVVAWERGDDPFAAERGLVVWQAPDGPGAGWLAVYAFTDPPRKGVLGIQPPQRGDLTGDGIDDLLTFEDMGGSGACGVARIVSPTLGAADELYRRATCDAETAIVGTALEIREAVYAPDDAHCCPSALRTTTLEWNGERFVRTDVVEEPT